MEEDPGLLGNRGKVGMAYRIILADSHAPFRKELKDYIEGENDIVVAAEIAEFAGLLRCLDSLSPDLILIDIFASDFGGIKAITRIRETCSNVKILVLTLYGGVDFMSKTLAAGANGYLLKEDAFEELPRAIESIQKGRKCVSPALDRRAPKIQTGAIIELERRT